MLPARSWDEAPVPVLVTENLREHVGPLAALIYGSASPRYSPRGDRYER